MSGQLLAPALVGELVAAPGALAKLALEVAARQPAPATRRTYASVYRAFTDFLGAGAAPAALTAPAVRAWRDRLEAEGRQPATIAKHLSALRTLAAAVGADVDIARVRAGRVERGEPRALDRQDLHRLLRMPDGRSHAGRRDLALLHLMASAGLRCSEVCALRVGDVDERRRTSNPALRAAIAGSTSWWLTVRNSKRGRSRVVPLSADALAAVTAWVKVRPESSSDLLLLSLPRTGAAPGPLSTRDAARIVGKHAAAAGLPEDRRAPHVLRHTFCTNLARADIGIDTIRVLAGHSDIRTTTIYTAVSSEQLEDAITAAARPVSALERLRDAA